MKLKKAFFLFFLVLSKSLFAFTFGVSGSIGGTSYNNRFFLQDKMKEKYKFIQSPIFSPIFFASIDVSLTKYFRLGIEGSLRTEVPFQSAEVDLIPEKSTLILSSKIQTRSLLLKLLYDMPISLKDTGYFGLGIGYSETSLSPWEYRLTQIETEKNFSKIFQEKKTSSFIFKIIAGRSYEIYKELFIDFCVEFSVIEWIIPSYTIASNYINPEDLGIWEIQSKSAFPAHPLDVSLGLRKTFTF